MMLLVTKRTIQSSAIRYGPIRERIVHKLQTKFKPTHLVVECESARHADGTDSERHFYVQIASGDFEGLRMVQMHRLVNNCLSEELSGPVHALRIDAYAASQFDNSTPTAPPKCERSHS